MDPGRRLRPPHGRRPRVLLAQFSHPLNDRNPFFCNKENLPLAAGYLRAMARARGLDREMSLDILEPFYADHAGDAAVLASLRERAPDVLALSLYPWNLMRSLHLAHALRCFLPELVVVGGGPEVNPACLPELLGRGLLDVAIPGEGEVTFAETLAALLEGRDLAQVAGTVVLRDGAVVAAPQRPTLVDLDEIPSPFLEGDLDLAPFREVHVLFERGCVYACKFCHWWPDKRSHGRFSLERIERELRFLRDTKVANVIFLDAALNASRHFEAVCDVLERVNGDGRLWIKAHVLFDRFTREQLERLSRGGVRWLEVGLQSASPEVLKQSRRPTDVALFERALGLAEGLPLELQVDFIMGLPGDTVAAVEMTAALIRDVAEKTRMAKVAPFVLSVGSASPLFVEAAGIGLRFQPEPPHRTLGQPGLDFKTLRELRQRVPELLGAPEHPYFQLDHPHYELNLFEPELGLHSGPKAPASRGDIPATIDTLRLRCAGGAPGHAHPFDAALASERLGQLATVWLETPDPAACASHFSRALSTLSQENLYGVWDIVVETGGPFELAALDALASAVHYRVNNLDWDNYMVNREEGRGFARVATRLVLLVPLGAAPLLWLEQANAAAAVVYALTIAGGDDVAGCFTEIAALPGEGVLVDVAPDLDAATTLATIAALARLDRRVRGCRDSALKALVEVERARRERLPRPRVPYRNRSILHVAQNGLTHGMTLARKRVLGDMARLSLGLVTATGLRTLRQA